MGSDCDGPGRVGVAACGIEASSVESGWFGTGFVLLADLAGAETLAACFPFDFLSAGAWSAFGVVFAEALGAALGAALGVDCLAGACFLVVTDLSWAGGSLSEDVVSVELELAGDGGRILDFEAMGAGGAGWAAGCVWSAESVRAARSRCSAASALAVRARCRALLLALPFVLVTGLGLLMLSLAVLETSLVLGCVATCEPLAGEALLELLLLLLSSP